jgi:hypothetical protein
MEIVNSGEISCRMRENVSNYISDKELMSRICKELIKLNSQKKKKKKNQDFKMGNRPK